MRPRIDTAVVAAVLATIAVAGFTVTAAGVTTGTGPQVQQNGDDSTPVETETTAAPDAGGQAPADQCDYSALYDRTIDSVVSILTNGGIGSGFVYETFENNSTAYVVTNAHVVGQAPDVTVQFTRGESVTGTVVGRDVYSDLAVVRVEDAPGYAEALPVSDTQPEHGERVAALGSPFGLDETITSGIVSGLNRSMPTEQGFSIPNVVQTDAAISPGNSGGPLVTCDGRVVGVNTAGIAARGAENIGFAVASTLVERVVPALIETGEFEHPTLGISATTVTPAVAEANNLSVSRGVIVVTVAEDAPAASVLQGSETLERVDGQVVPVGGDVVLSVEGRNVSTTEDLASVLLAESRPGDEVSLTVLRDGRRVNVTTTVTERPPPRGDQMA